MTSDLQQYSARIRRFVTFLWVISAMLIALERFSAVSIRLVNSGFTSDAWRAFACQAAAAFPEALYLLGLWWVREAVAAFARGELFGPPITRMLHRVGIVLFCASVVRICIVPGACRLLGFDLGYWIAFDAAGLVLAALGIAFKSIAAVLRHASAVQSELDEIF